MARPRKGHLEWRKCGWCARLTVNVDGESIQQWHKLGTENRAVARRKMARLVAANLPMESAAELAASEETVNAFGTDWIAKREALALPTAAYERRIFERIWRPAIGPLALSAARPHHFADVLEDAATGKLQWVRTRVLPDGTVLTKKGRYSRQSIVHIRATAFRLFKAARAVELIAANPVDVVALPAMKKEPKRERAVLSDAEIATLLAHAKVDLEIKMLVLLSRTIGGMRAGDLNAWDWTQIDLVHFAGCTVPRQKTGKPQGMDVPEAVRPFLRLWWERHGSPTSGPVFPVRRGKRAGEAKKKSNMSYADRLRRELLKAGITRHELHHATATTKPVDFHSTRRAYSSALARGGVNSQTSMLLSGHSDPKVHQGYVNSLVGRALPEAAMLLLPSVDVVPAERVQKPVRKPPLAAGSKRRARHSGADVDQPSPGRTDVLTPPEGVSAQFVREPLFAASLAPPDSSTVSLERDTGFEPATPSLGSEPRESYHAKSSSNSHQSADHEAPRSGLIRPDGINSVRKPVGWSAVLADLGPGLVKAALKLRSGSLDALAGPP